MNTLFSKNSAFLNNIRSAIILCIIIVSLVITAELLLIKSILAKMESNVQTIEKIGTQRTLSQKIVKNLYAYPNDSALHYQIKKDALEWHDIHNTIEKEAIQKFRTENADSKVDSLFTGMNTYQNQLYNMVVSNGYKNLVDDYHTINEWEEQFLTGMDALTVLYQADLESNLSRLENLVKLFSFFFVLLILAMYFFLLNPLIKSKRNLADKQKAQFQNMVSIVENTQDLIWSVDTNFTLLIFNSNYKKRIKLEQGITPSPKGYALDHPLFDATKDRQLYQRAFKGETFRMDYKLSHKGKTTYHVLSYNPIRNGEGAIVGCNVVRRNETQRIDTINKLRQSKEMLQEAQTISRMGNWAWEIRKDELHWSEELYHIFDKDPESYKPSYDGLLQVIHPEDREMFDNKVKDCLANDKPYDIVHRIILPGRSIKYIHERGIVIYGRDGQPERMAGTAQDVTELENAKNEILRQYEELQNFIYIISHNVRSPIAILQGLIGLFRDGDDTIDKELIEMIGHKVNVLDQTTRDLTRTLSLKKAPKSSYEWLDLKELMQNTEELLKVEISASGTVIQRQINPSHQVYAIKEYLMDIFYHLVLNAIKFRRDSVSPKVRVITEFDPKLGTMDIIVEDNGIGMDLNEEKRKRIFGMYGRLNGKSEGKGLGLYLVKTQLEAMNGTISVSSQPGLGSKFTISLIKGNERQAHAS